VSAAHVSEAGALVKRSTRELGLAWILRLMARCVGHDLYTVRLSGPEAIAALTRKARTGEVAVPDADRTRRAFRRHWQRHLLLAGARASCAGLP